MEQTQLQVVPRNVDVQYAVPKLDLGNFNDHGNSLRFGQFAGHDARWCEDTKKHLLWDGRRWAVDRKVQILQVATNCMVEFLKQAAAAGDKDARNFANSSLNRKDLRDMLEVAKPWMALSADQQDTDPMKLNFQNGTLDLKTGVLGPHCREDYITKLVHYDYLPEAECPRFMTFLERIMGGGPDASEAESERADRMISFLQKAFGHSLTGSVREKVVFIFHGALGDNGKSTLLTTFRRVIDEYAAIIQMDTLVGRDVSSNASADLADLRGARFAMTTETEKDQRLAEARLKRICQGVDGAKIKSCRKYENPIHFVETHKLWIDGNHLPAVQGFDGAIWSRLCPIPFDVKIPSDEIDRELPEKLIREAEGILAWAVAGALRWQQEGLGRTDEIREAHSNWRKDAAEPLKEFFDEYCTRKLDGFVLRSTLWDMYLRWCGRQKVAPLSREKFAGRLEDIGFQQKMHRLGGEDPERCWSGMALR
ncbi:MAG: phage/plasmid primase, P4 family [Bryobacteraceae bacterium]